MNDKEHIKKLEKRIHNQRVMLRQNWETLEQRILNKPNWQQRMWLCYAIKLMHENRKLKAVNEILRSRYV